MNDKPIIIKTLLFCIILIICLGADASFGTPVNEKLRQTESSHFIYIFQESLEGQMPQFIKHCEDAHTLLSPVFNWEPKQKTVVMYFDAMDIHNGWATVYPRPTMMIYASDTTANSTIYEPGDYIRRTIFHEYTHILTMDPQFGFDSVLSAIFGRAELIVGDPLSLAIMMLSIPPGAVAPAWYLEGLAIWAETEFVGPGRGRNSLVDMIMRMAVSENRMLYGKDWWLYLPEWPYGEAAYLYGLKTIEYIHDNYSEGDNNAPGEISDAVVHSFLFNFNIRSSSITNGNKFSHLAQYAIHTELVRQQSRIQQLKKTPLTQIERLTENGLNVISPKFDQNGRYIYFSGKKESGRDCLYSYNVKSARIERIGSARTTYAFYSQLAMGSECDTLYYTRLNIQGRECLRNELCQLNLSNNKSKIISKKGRYRYPVIKNSKLTAVVTETGQQYLVSVPLNHLGISDFEQILYKAPDNTSIVQPSYSPDGRFLAFIQASEGHSQIRQIDITTGANEVILEWPCTILSPIYHPSNNNIIFVSDKNGVYNLYELSFDNPQNPSALTHVLGGLFEPDFSPDGKKLVAAGYDSYGYYLTILDYETLRSNKITVPSIEDDWKSLPANLEKIEMATHAIPDKDDIISKNYNSLLAVKFDGWSPWLTTNGEDVMGGACFALSDPAYYHNLFFLFGAETTYNTSIETINYQYQGLYPIFTLYGNHGIESYYNLLSDENNLFYDYEEEVKHANIAVSFPWNRIDWQSKLSLGISFSDRRKIDDWSQNYNSNTLVQKIPFEGIENSVWGQFDIFNGTAYHRSHSVEDGIHLSLVGEQSNRIFGGELDRLRFRLDQHCYLGMPWAENHILKLEGVFAIGTGDETTQGLFGLGQGLAFISNSLGLERNISLRGYDTNYQVGDRVIKAGIAYRFPIFHVYKNINTTSPFYFHQLFGEVYYEGGIVKNSNQSSREKDKWLKSVGMELNFSTTIFRFIPIAPGIGVVYAFDYEKPHRYDDMDYEEDSKDKEKLQLYFSLKTMVNF